MEAQESVVLTSTLVVSTNELVLSLVIDTVAGFVEDRLARHVARQCHRLSQPHLAARRH